MRKVRLEFDRNTAARIAEFLEQSGAAGAAVHTWRCIRNSAPYDVAARERLARLLWQLQQERCPRGTVQRAQLLLSIIGESFPTDELTNAYFDNLERLLHPRARGSPGSAVFLGIGPGRCGSTSLCAAFAGIANSCATHENPPLIDWQPQDAQIRFHLRRFEFLSRCFSVVFDASHWWLNVLDHFFLSFPRGKVIALRRRTEDCVRSFLKIKGAGWNSINHWAPRDSRMWTPNLWDPVYPSYEMPSGSEREPDQAKEEQIRRYVREYDDAVQRLAAQRRDQVLLLQTELLSDATSVQLLREFTGLPVVVPARPLNAGSVEDGAASNRFRL